MGRYQQTGRCARKIGTHPYANSTSHSQRASKAIDTATALGRGAPPQNAMLSGIAGLQGLTQPSLTDPLFGWPGLDQLVGGTGLIEHRLD